MPFVGHHATASPSQVSEAATKELPTDRFKRRDCRLRRTCEHGKFKPYCKECKGSMLCAHLRHKNRCAACKASSITTGASGGVTLVIQ